MAEMTDGKEEPSVEEALKRYGLELKLVESNEPDPGQSVEPGVPPQKPEEFDWQNAFRQLMGLMQTGGPPPPKKGPPKARKQWKWSAKKPEGLGVGRWTPTPPVDFSSVGLSNFDSDLVMKPRVVKQPPQRCNKGLFVTNTVKFSQNQISSLCGLDSFMMSRFADPSMIQWLDLSYNRISEIDPVLSMLPRLKTLYLHCNCLSDIDEVRNLRFMPRLNILTLFGNPLETAVDYRLKIIAALPMLKRLDWGLVITRERKFAKVYVKKMMEKDAKEALEMKRAEAAAAEKLDALLKKIERRRKWKLEKEMSKKPVTDEEIVEKLEEKAEEPPKEAEEVSNELKVVKVVTEVEPELEEEQSERMTAEDETEETLVPLDLAEIGPLDVKGKHKRHPDPLPTTLTVSIDSSPSSTSFCSVETVCLEDIKQEFQRLKELEASVKFKV